MAGTLDGILPEPSPRGPKKSIRWLAIFPALAAAWLFVPFCVALLQGQETTADCVVTITRAPFRPTYGTRRRLYRHRYQDDYIREVKCAYFAQGSMRYFSLWAHSKPEGRFATPVRYVEGKPDWKTAPEFVLEEFSLVFLFVFLALLWWSWIDVIVPWAGNVHRPRSQPYP